MANSAAPLRRKFNPRQLKRNVKKPQLKSREASQRETPQTIINVGSIDYTTLLIVFLLVLIGVVMVFTSSIYISEADSPTGDIFHYVKRHAVFAASGFGIMLVVSNISYRYLMRFAKLGFWVSNILLVLVQILGKEAYGKSRWIELPFIGGQFQPSELAKAAIIIFVAYLIHKNQDYVKTWTGFVIICSLVALTTGLVLLGGLSSAIITAIIGFGIIFIASPHIGRFLVLGGVGVAGVIGIISIPSEFRDDRVAAWLDPFAFPTGTGYQIIQSLYAIASGGIFGLGIGQSRQRSFLPFPHNDFIFAIVCEELGLVGAVLVITLFAMLIWRGINISIKAPDMFGSLVAAGIVLMIGSQVIINVAVVTNSIPNTGVTMPLISYGGTSLWITMALMGVLLNISRHSREV